jgi:hypothetical protein
MLLGTELFLKQPPHTRMAAGGARARQQAGRDQRSGSTGRTLAAAGIYARSVSFTLASWPLHRSLFFILFPTQARQRQPQKRPCSCCIAASCSCGAGSRPYMPSLGVSSLDSRPPQGGLLF